MNEKYEKIINLPHHVSFTRPQMPRADRAAQFAPYSALSGYEDAVCETARQTDREIELDEYEKEKINATLTTLLTAPSGAKVSVTYFRPDKRKSGGAYITVTGELAHVDRIAGELTIADGRTISFDKIIDISLKK